MSAQDNAITLGKPNQNLVLETAGRIYVKVQDRFYELDFRNQGRGSGDTKIEIVNNSSNNQDIDLKGYVTKEFLKASLNSYVTKRSWNDVKETQSMLENAMLDGFTESINPITIQTMQVIVGADQLQFEFVNNFIDANETTYGPNLYKNSIEFIEPSEGIYIKHYTLDGPTDVRPEDPNDQTQLNQLKMQYCRWRIAPNRFDLGDPSASYYIYIKVPRLRDDSGWINSSDPMTIYTKTNAEGTSVYNQYGLGEFVLSNTAIEMTSESNYYYLLYGMINSDDGNGRSFSTMNGFTEILPGQITAYIFKSASGDSYLDLRKNELKLGDAFQWNINNNHILYIKGAIVVDDGGNESYMYLDRGIFHRYRYQTTENGPFLETDNCSPTGAYHTEGNVYYKGNTVTWTNDKGITSTYMYIGDTTPNADASCYEFPDEEVGYNYNPATTYYDPTNENFWRVLAQGVRGYSNLIADLSNEMEAIACDKEGYVITANGLDVTTQAGLFYGSSDVELGIKPNTQDTPNITIDLSEIEALNPQPEDPNDPRNPTVTYTISNIQDDYQKLITFHIDHGALIPEKCEIPITLVSKNKYGEEQDDTRIIVFTLVGVRSGKAYGLVPSTRTVRRTPTGLYDPLRFTCGVICNGSSENVNINEVVVKNIRGDSAVIHTQANPNGVEISVNNISSYLNDFINDHNLTNGYSLDWDYTTLDDVDVDYIEFSDALDFEKITLFLYYKDPLSFNWILCDKETIHVVKDGDPGKDFSISASSNVFMYETKTSKVPSNSSIILKGVPKNFKEVDYYTWEYRVPEYSNNWISIKPGEREKFDNLTEHQYWWKPDNVSTNPDPTVYQADPLLRSTLIINAPLSTDVYPNGGYVDFNKYFPRNTSVANDESSRYRMCEFQVTVHYKELGTATTLTDGTSLHIIKGGDGALTLYLPNASMLFSSTEKKGVTFGLSESTEIVAYYGIDQIFPTASNSPITATISAYRYKNSDDTTYTGSTVNAVTATVTSITDTANNVDRLYVIVNTGSGLVSEDPFLAASGEIDVDITITLAGKIQETRTLTRTIYWNTAKQGEPGAGKQLRGRSDWDGIKGYASRSEDYQGLNDVEATWDSKFNRSWKEEYNIFFDIVRYPNDNSAGNTYYCKNGGKSAFYGEPGTSGYLNETLLTPDNNQYAWEKMTYSNIASDVAWINRGLIENLTVGSLHTKGEDRQLPTLHGAQDEWQTVNQIGIDKNFINISDYFGNTIIDISSSNILPDPSSSSSSTTDGYVGGNSIALSSSLSSETWVFSNSISGEGLLTLNKFSITVNKTSQSSSLTANDSYIYGQVWLTTNSSGGSGFSLGNFQSVQLLGSETFNFDGGLYRISNNTWYIVVNISYVPSSDINISCSSTSAYYTLVPPTTDKDGTIIAGNGFQTRWSQFSGGVTKTTVLNVNDSSNGPNLIMESPSCNINVSGTVSLSGTVTSNNVNVLTSNDTPRIYIQQTTIPTSSSPDGLYFIY